MNLADSLSYAADYTRRLFSRLGDLVILTIISIIPIVNLLAWGYFGRIIKESQASKDPPKVERYTDMFIGGLKVLGAALIWSIPMIIIITLLALTILLPFIGLVAMQPFSGNWTLFEQMMQYGNWTSIGDMMRHGYWSNVGAFALAMIPLIIVIVIVAFFIGLIAMLGIVHMFKTGSFTKAFAIGEIFHIMQKIGFLRYIALPIITIILGSIIGLFEMIPVIGWIIGAFLSLLLGIFLARAIGLLYDEALGIAPAGLYVSSTMPPPPPPLAPVQPMPSGAPATATQNVFCVNCGAANSMEAKYCFKCGRALTKS